MLRHASPSLALKTHLHPTGEMTRKASNKYNNLFKLESRKLKKAKEESIKKQA